MLLLMWAPPVLWMGFIFIMSTGEFSADMTKGIVYPVLKFFFHYAGDNILIPIHMFIRKTGHINEYGVLSFFLFRALREQMKTWKAVLSAVIASFLYAISDEFHQSFVSVRTASPVDVAIDALGAALMQGLLWFHRKL